MRIKIGICGLHYFQFFITLVYFHLWIAYKHQGSSDQNIKVQMSYAKIHESF